MMNSLFLAKLCNDIYNHKDYSIDGQDCYYKGELIGKFESVYTLEGIKINYLPIKAVEYIEVNFTLSKNGKIEFKE